MLQSLCTDATRPLYEHYKALVATVQRPCTIGKKKCPGAILPQHSQDRKLKQMTFDGGAHKKGTKKIS